MCTSAPQTVRTSSLERKARSSSKDTRLLNFRFERVAQTASSKRLWCTVAVISGCASSTTNPRIYWWFKRSGAILTSHLTSHIMRGGALFMTKWQLQEAKARFSELIDETLEKGPQVVTRRGIDTAVVVSIDEWRKLKDEKRLTWKDVLLGEGSRFEIPLPKRGMVKSRRTTVFD